MSPRKQAPKLTDGPVPPKPESEKKDFDKAVDEFQAADTQLRWHIDRFLTGDYILDLAQNLVDKPAFVGLLQEEHKKYVEHIEKLTEDRNAKLKTAQNALRQSVVLGPTQWRGPDGKTDSMSVGPFVCTSVTKRTFDSKSLLDGVQKHGLLERLLSLTNRDKEGNEYNIVEQVWAIDYEPVKNWLAANKLDDVLKGAYDEQESTPQVKGPKPVALLGQEIKT